VLRGDSAGPAVALSNLTGSVQVSHFLKAELLENKGEPFRFLHVRHAGVLLETTQIQKAPMWVLFVFVWSRQESNLHFSLRRGVSYPLNDETVDLTLALYVIFLN
jgi:hypothetical protein